jgi:hypothetical protein
MKTFGAWLIAATCLATGAAVATTMTTIERNASLSELCAARDLEALALLEQQEETEGLANDALADALFIIVQARTVCEQGRVAEALAIYDSVGAATAQSAQRR